MSEKEEVIFDADVLRRLEFLEGWHNKIVESTELAKCASGAFAFLSFLALLGCGIFGLLPSLTNRQERRRLLPRPSAN